MSLAPVPASLAVSLARGPQLWPRVRILAVLGPDPDDRLGWCLAEIAGVDQQAAPATPHGEDELRHRDVGNGFEDIADAAVYAVDAAGQVDVDLAVQGDDEVGQAVAR